MRIAFFIASKGNWFDKLVGCALSGTYSHSTLEVYPNKWFSAHPFKGVAYVYNEVYDPSQWTMLDLPMTPLQETKVREWCDLQVNRFPYSFWGALRCWCRLLPPDPLPADFCSEIDEDALSRVFTCHIDARDMDPNALYLHCLKLV